MLPLRKLLHKLKLSEVIITSESFDFLMHEIHVFFSNSFTVFNALKSIDPDENKLLSINP